MGILDNAREQASKAAADNPEKVEQLSDQGIERAGDAADNATGGKFSGQVDSAQEQADQRVGE